MGASHFPGGTSSLPLIFLTKHSPAGSSTHPCSREKPGTSRSWDLGGCKSTGISRFAHAPAGIALLMQPAGLQGWLWAQALQRIFPLSTDAANCNPVSLLGKKMKANSQVSLVACTVKSPSLNPTSGSLSFQLSQQRGIPPASSPNLRGKAVSLYPLPLVKAPPSPLSPLPRPGQGLMDCNPPLPRSKQRSRPEEIANNFCPPAPEEREHL